MTTKNNFTDCSSLPEVALPFMNTVHCEELTLVGDLQKQLDSKAEPAIIDQQMAAWVDHTVAHFAREERLMAEYSFFAYVPHQMEHEQALQELRVVQQQWSEERNYEALSSYIMNWRAWLELHIGSMDFVTAQFLSQFDINVELPVS